MSDFFATLTRGDDTDIEVVVEFKYYAGCRGARDSLGGVRGAGPPLEPDDPPEVEILSVKDLATKAKLELSDAEMARIETLCWEHVHNYRHDPEEP